MEVLRKPSTFGWPLASSAQLSRTNLKGSAWLLIAGQTLGFSAGMISLGQTMRGASITSVSADKLRCVPLVRGKVQYPHSAHVVAVSRTNS
jgi:hypothetical protein